MVELVVGGFLVGGALLVVWLISRRDRVDDAIDEAHRLTLPAEVTSWPTNDLPRREPPAGYELLVTESPGHQWYRDRLPLTTAQRNAQIGELEAAYYQPPVSPGRDQ